MTDLGEGVFVPFEPLGLHLALVRRDLARIGLLTFGAVLLFGYMAGQDGDSASLGADQSSGVLGRIEVCRLPSPDREAPLRQIAGEARRERYPAIAR